LATSTAHSWQKSQSVAESGISRAHDAHCFKASPAHRGTDRGIPGAARAVPGETAPERPDPGSSSAIREQKWNSRDNSVRERQAPAGLARGNDWQPGLRECADPLNRPGWFHRSAGDSAAMRR
jgi:hypothetical protein